jgi:branched-chain amino acid transport system substrate-binding protein
MKSSKETKLLILSLLVTTAMLGGGFWLWNQASNPSPNSPRTSDNRRPTPDSASSLGEKILVTADSSVEKIAGVATFAKGDFVKAEELFQASLLKKRNDPEALIYLNNSLAAKGKSLKITVSVPIGGNLGVAKEILRGVAQAQNEVNHNGGINGNLLQVAIANDNNDPSQAQQVATQFVKDTSILAVVGHNASNVSIAVAPVYQQGGLVMISPTSSAQNLSNIGSYIFRTVASNATYAQSLSRYTTQKLGKTNIGICIDSKSVDTQSFKDEFVKSLVDGKGKVNPTDCDIASPDFNPSAIISQLISSGADSLVLSPHVDRLNKAIELAAANDGRLTLLASPTFYRFQTLQVGKANVKGLVLPVPWHSTAIPGNPFPQNAKQLWGGNVNWRTATAYDATIAIAKALEQGNSREALQKTLRSSNFSVNGATGKLQFQPSGDREGTAILVKIQPSSQSPAGYDFFPL